MSISSRITEIEQHIGNAYDKIEDLGIDLTDVDKNINNISSMLENVWDEYPKVSTSDVEEASLNGTKKGRINIDLKGNTKQEQLTGKNLFDLSNLTSQTINGVTFTPYYENGLLKYINVNGTATANTVYNLATSYTMPAGSYILNGCPSGGSWGTYSMAYGDKNDSGNGKSFNLNDSYSGQAYIRIGNGTTVNNIKFYPMIRLSSVTDSSYEPYCRTEYQAQTQNTHNLLKM